MLGHVFLDVFLTDVSTKSARCCEESENVAPKTSQSTTKKRGRLFRKPSDLTAVLSPAKPVSFLFLRLLLIPIFFCLQSKKKFFLTTLVKNYSYIYFLDFLLKIRATLVHRRVCRRSWIRVWSVTSAGEAIR